jgi:hypothetical protein
MTPKQALPLVAVAIALPRQTPPAAGKSVAKSALGAAPVPKALKQKKLHVKKSTL